MADSKASSKTPAVFLQHSAFSLQRDISSSNNCTCVLKMSWSLHQLGEFSKPLMIKNNFTASEVDRYTK